MEIKQSGDVCLLSKSEAQRENAPQQDDEIKKDCATDVQILQME
jgi:hypothetical protein